MELDDLLIDYLAGKALDALWRRVTPLVRRAWYRFRPRETVVWVAAPPRVTLTAMPATVTVA